MGGGAAVSAIPHFSQKCATSVFGVPQFGQYIAFSLWFGPRRPVPTGPQTPAGEVARLGLVTTYTLVVRVALQIKHGSLRPRLASQRGPSTCSESSAGHGNTLPVLPGSPPGTFQAAPCLLITHGIEKMIVVASYYPISISSTQSHYPTLDDKLLLIVLNIDSLMHFLPDNLRL